MYLIVISCYTLKELIFRRIIPMYYIIAIFILIIDQLWKSAIVKWMEIGQTIPIWEGVFHITSLRNKGAAFGILQNQRLFFIIVTLIAVFGIIYYLQTEGKKNRRISFALSLLLGGALGNFYDRLVSNHVHHLMQEALQLKGKE